MGAGYAWLTPSQVMQNSEEALQECHVCGFRQPRAIFPQTPERLFRLYPVIAQPLQDGLGIFP